MAIFGGFLAHAWRSFNNQSAPESSLSFWSRGQASSARPDRGRPTVTNERSIVQSIYTRIAIDTASLDVRHVRLDEDGRYLEEIPSDLNYCFKFEANIDQATTDFKQDIVETLLSKGVAALVPVETDIDPDTSGAFIIKDMRVGEVVEWMPRHVKVNVYNDETGRREDLVLSKRHVSVVVNPFYSVMNEPNSTLQRLVNKLNMLDAVDKQSSSGKLDMIIQLPYVIKSESRRQQADQRRKDIETQLTGSQYGIAYTDGTEKITQLNRPAENNLLKQVEYLTEMLYGQLGITAEVMNGTADEAAMLNYHNRTVDPIMRAAVEGMRRTFLTKTARTQGQSIMYFRDPFRLVPIAQIAEIADKFTRNEITTSNEIRQAIGMKPSKDKKADQLVNSNMPTSDTGVELDEAGEEDVDDPADVENSALDELGADLDDILGSLGEV